MSNLSPWFMRRYLMVHPHFRTYDNQKVCEIASTQRSNLGCIKDIRRPNLNAKVLECRSSQRRTHDTNRKKNYSNTINIVMYQRFTVPSVICRLGVSALSNHHHATCWIIFNFFHWSQAHRFSCVLTTHIIHGHLLLCIFRVLHVLYDLLHNGMVVSQHPIFWSHRIYKNAFSVVEASSPLNFPQNELIICI